MFYDEAKIHVRSGDGGDGMISFRREKFVRQGGPDGGDGGRGGDVVFVATEHLNSLINFQHQKHYRAANGVHGTVQRMTGANGEDLRLQVPVGTIVRNAESGDVLADLTAAGQEVVILAGGRGGRGNIHFANSRSQAPRVAARGEPGEEMWLPSIGSAMLASPTWASSACPTPANRPCCRPSAPRGPRSATTPSPPSSRTWALWPWTTTRHWYWPTSPA